MLSASNFAIYIELILNTLTCFKIYKTRQHCICMASRSLLIESAVLYLGRMYHIWWIERSFILIERHKPIKYGNFYDWSGDLRDRDIGKIDKTRSSSVEYIEPCQKTQHKYMYKLLYVLLKGFSLFNYDIIVYSLIFKEE